MSQVKTKTLSAGGLRQGHCLGSTTYRLRPHWGCHDHMNWPVAICLANALRPFLVLSFHCISLHSQYWQELGTFCQMLSLSKKIRANWDGGQLWSSRDFSLMSDSMKRNNCFFFRLSMSVSCMSAASTDGFLTFFRGCCARGNREILSSSVHLRNIFTILCKGHLAVASVCTQWRPVHVLTIWPYCDSSKIWNDFVSMERIAEQPHEWFCEHRWCWSMMTNDPDWTCEMTHQSRHWEKFRMKWKPRHTLHKRYISNQSESESNSRQSRYQSECSVISCHSTAQSSVSLFWRLIRSSVITGTEAPSSPSLVNWTAQAQ